MSSPRENYGIDAPGVVRLLLGTGGALVVAGFLGLWLTQAGHDSDNAQIMRDNGFAISIWFLIGGSWMLISSLWLKKRMLQRLLNDRIWRGDEKVLDVGCGRGLVAVGAAKRLSRGGRVIGIDLWQQKDLDGNNPDAAALNAQIAGVIDQVRFDTGDARALPYDDASFDVVASMTVIHNIPGREGRRKAIDEIWRVTKPHGQILIFDIRHGRSYAAQLRSCGATVRLTGPWILWGMLGWRLSAIKGSS
jgi:arsenite methyltransferase